MLVRCFSGILKQKHSAVCYSSANENAVGGTDGEQRCNSEAETVTAVSNQFHRERVPLAR